MDAKELKAQLEAAKKNLQDYKEKRLAASQGAPAGETKTFAVQEKQICSKWGVKSLNELLKVNTADKRFSYMSSEDREAVKAFKEACDITLMIADRFKKAPQDTGYYHDGLVPTIKALGINSGESGFEWIPRLIADSYVEEYNLERKVAGLFSEVKMPSNPYTYPVLTIGAIATKLGEASKKSSPDSFSTTSTITFTAVKLTNQYELPEELQEDSAPDVMKVIRQELINGQEKAMEIAILNGDTATVHQDANTLIPGLSGAPAADSPERVFDGLRKRALAAGSSAKVDAGGAPVNESHLSSARQKLGKFGVNPAELAFIVGPRGYNEMMQLDDVRTLEQYGPQAPVLVGELAKYEGIPVVVSEYMREDLTSAGVNANSASTFAAIMLVNRKRWYCGLRRAIQVRVENYRTQFDVWDMVSFSRRAFQGILLADGSNFSTEKSAAIIVNIA